MVNLPPHIDLGITLLVEVRIMRGRALRHEMDTVRQYIERSRHANWQRGICMHTPSCPMADIYPDPCISISLRRWVVDYCKTQAYSAMSTSQCPEVIVTQYLDNHGVFCLYKHCHWHFTSINYDRIFQQKILVCDVFISLCDICKFYLLLCVMWLLLLSGSAFGAQVGTHNPKMRLAGFDHVTTYYGYFCKWEVQNLMTIYSNLYRKYNIFCTMSGIDTHNM